MRFIIILKGDSGPPLFALSVQKKVRFRTKKVQKRTKKVQKRTKNVPKRYRKEPKMQFFEPIRTNILVSAKTERDAYIIICINELLHSLGLTDEATHSITYAVMSDNDMFKLF